MPVQDKSSPATIDDEGLYTLQYGVVVSKPIAALWAQAALEARWTPLIEAALAWSSDIVPDLDETLRFIDDTRRASER